MTQFFQFTNLCRHFEQNGRYIMESGSVEPGHILAIRGPSGAGKSTLLKMLARLIIPESGEIIFRGQSWQTISPMAWRTRVHYVAQKPVMFPGTLEENFRMPFKVSSILNGKGFSRENMLQYMAATDLPLSMLSQEAGTLSGGEAARAALIRALLVEPEILLLDEPTAYLDGDNRAAVIDLLNQWVFTQERAIIVVSHKDEDISELDNVSILTVAVGKARE
jgi:putative ABC transport system ATP-binding protein